MTARCDGAQLKNAENLFHQRKLMSVNVTTDPILMRFRDALHEMYGANIERVVLFGSRARGDVHCDSDYDVAVFLNHIPDISEERNRLANLRVDFLDDTGAFFDARPYLVSAWDNQTPLMHEIRKDGLDL